MTLHRDPERLKGMIGFFQGSFKCRMKFNRPRKSFQEALDTGPAIATN
jgi:hypothetical protein